jgi:hypothetical protein
MLLNGHIEKHVRLFQVLKILLPVFHQVLELAQFFLCPLGPDLVVPEIRGQGLGFESFYVKLFAV